MNVSTAPTIDTAATRVKYMGLNYADSWMCDDIDELCAAVDTLRAHFAAQQVYINSLEKRLNQAAE